MSKNGISGFNSERLQQIMTIRGLTQAQLAAMVGVSTSTLSKWKNGQHMPDIDALNRLANILDVTAEWFTRPIISGIEIPLFRSNASAYKHARLMLKERLSWLEESVMYLSEYIDFPKQILPKREFVNPKEISQIDIEIAALEFREIMGLGQAPIQNLLLAVEGAGVIVVREITDISTIEGLSTWGKGTKIPLILLSADKDNYFRSRFDLAHELGHLILHKHIPDKLRDTFYKTMEEQAHAFAGALLLPEDSFVSKIRIPTTLDDLLIQKQYWGISVAAIIMRLHKLGLIDDDAKTNLFKRRSARWGAKSEPGDKDRQPEKPVLLKRTIELLINEKILDIENMKSYFGLGQKDLINLLGLNVDFFERKNSKIIPFTKLKKYS